MVEIVKRYTAVGMAWADSCEHFKCEEAGEYSRVDPRVFCCEDGLHATRAPLDALRYYRFVAEFWKIEFWKVEVTESTNVSHHENERETRKVERKGVACSRMGFDDLARAQIGLMLEPGGAAGEQAGVTTVESGLATAERPFGVAMSTKQWGIAAASGGCGLAAALGKRSIATVSGHGGLSVASEVGGAAMSIGGRGVAVASGESGTATVAGRNGLGVASGQGGVVLASQEGGIAIAAGERGLAVAAGEGGWACGSLGSWIVVAERDGDGRVIDVRTAVVDGEKVRADTYYSLRGGILVERS